MGAEEGGGLARGVWDRGSPAVTDGAEPEVIGVDLKVVGDRVQLLLRELRPINGGVLAEPEVI